MANYQYMMSAEDIAEEFLRHFGQLRCLGMKLQLIRRRRNLAYKGKDTKKWTAQWFETNAKGEKKKHRKRGFETKREALKFEQQKKLNNSRSMDMELSEFIDVYFEDKKNE